MDNSDSKGNRQAFKTVVIKLGVKPVEHFPKVKGKDGQTQKDENGNDVRSEEWAGAGTSTQESILLNKQKVPLSGQGSVFRISPLKMCHFCKRVILS